MDTFTASRLSAGNKVFPSQIIIDSQSLTFKVPGLFSGNEKTIPFSKIASVDIDCPMFGYSTIIVETTGEGNVRAHGFTKTEVKSMKELILQKI